MSSSNQIAYALQLVKSTSGKKAKESLLRVLHRDYPEESAKVMRAIFDKDTTYGIKKIPEATNATLRPRQFHAGTWGLLSRLASRELTGKAAIDAVSAMLGQLSLPSRELLICILQQNLRAGFGIDTVVEIWGPIVETFDICLAQEWRQEMYKNKRARIASTKKEFDPKYHSGYFPVWCDFKYDGYRGFYFEGEDAIVSRRRLPTTVAPGLIKTLKAFVQDLREHYGVPAHEQLFIDCEAVSPDGVFRDVMSSSRSKKKGAAEGSQVLKIIDILTVREVYAGVSDLGQTERREKNEELFAHPTFAKYAPHIMLTEGEWCKDVEAVEALVQKAWANDLEGLIVKCGPWENKRSYGWLKYKREGSAKGRIKGYVMSDPLSKNAGMVGSIIMEEDSGVRSNISGMTDEMRKFVTENQDALLDEQIESDFHERTPDGVQRHPRLKSIRSDRA